MAIQRWDPMRDLMQLRESVNRLFEETLSRSPGDGGATATAGDWRPPLDLYETEDRYVLRADLPGLTAAEVELRIEDGRLVLSGERKAERGLAQQAFLRVERPHGRFATEIALPTSVDRERIEAAHRNGVLEIVLPKRKTPAPDRIRIHEGP
jgi:HSP20 family protein